MSEELESSSNTLISPSTGSENQGLSEPGFRDLLPEEYRGMYPEFKKPEDFVKGYDSLVRKLGSSVSLPKDDAPQEELDKFYNKLGRPEAPEKYEFELNDNTKVDDEFLNKFKKAAYENGISQKQAREMFNWYNRELEGVEQSITRAQEEAQEKAKAELKARWGKDYDKKLEEVQGFAKNLAGEKYYENLIKYGNDPDFIHVLSEVQARYVKEDRISHSGTTHTVEKDYLGEARKLMAEPDYKFNQSKQTQVQQLFAQVAKQRSK